MYTYTCVHIYMHIHVIDTERDNFFFFVDGLRKGSDPFIEHDLMVCIHIIHTCGHVYIHMYVHIWYVQTQRLNM